MIDIKPKSVLEQPIYMLTKATPCPYLKGRVEKRIATDITYNNNCLLYTSPSPRD